MVRHLIFLALLFWAVAEGLAQSGEVLENTPNRINWRQVNSPHFRVLFQAGSDSLAVNTINKLERLYQPVSQTLDADPGKISIVLQNKSSISNGFVSPAPRRSEFYIMPPQDYNFLGTNRWVDLLSIHEYRHVAQYRKSKTGWNKIIFYLFGEAAYAGMAYLAMPQWFWEGDAVGVETALSQSGRGRIPDFNVAFRANLLERGPFDYDKQYLRSFNDYVPDHYVTGYFMTTHVRRRFGKDAWSRVSERAFHAPFLPGRTPYSLRKETGAGLIATYDNMIDELDSVWRRQLEGLELTPAEQINKREDDVYTSYSYPQAIGDGKVVALKSGLGDIQQFVLIDSTGAEKVLFTPGPVNDAGMLSANGGKLVWNEYRYNPRWRAVNYSVIQSYDFDKDKAEQLTGETRYSAAAASPDGSRVVTVYTDEQGVSYLVATGENGKRFPNPDDAFYLMPRWSDDGESIVAVKLLDGRKAIALIDFETGEETLLTGYSSENIGHPVMFGKYILYNSPYSGIDNIYALDMETGAHYQATSRKYGAYNPSVSPGGRYIYFNDYTAYGMNVARMPFDPGQWVLKTDIDDRNTRYYQPLVEQEDNPDVLEDIDYQNYPVSRYRRIQGLVNPYAWGAYVDPAADYLFLGVASQDVLSTLAFSAGYEIDASTRDGAWTGRLSYQAAFPIIDVSFLRSNGSAAAVINNVPGNILWTENALEAGLRLPLLLTHSKYHEQLTLGANVKLSRLDNYRFRLRNGTETTSSAIDFRSVTYNFNYSRNLKRSKRDIRSRWGQGLRARYVHTPLRGDLEGSQFAAQGYLLFPGLVKHHSLQLRGAYQYEPSSSFLFNSGVTFPRGYSYAPQPRFLLGSVSYAAPLAYPDFNIGSLLNIQRIKLNLFYDLGAGITNSIADYFNSVGAELSFDVNFFRLLPLIDVGVQYAYVPEEQAHRFGLLIGSFSY